MTARRITESRANGSTAEPSPTKKSADSVVGEIDSWKFAKTSWGAEASAQSPDIWKGFHYGGNFDDPDWLP